MSGITLAGRISTILNNLGTPASGDVATNIDTLIARLTSGRATNLDNLDAPTQLIDTNVDTLVSRLTAARAGNLDDLDAPISGISVTSPTNAVGFSQDNINGGEADMLDWHGFKNHGVSVKSGLGNWNTIVNLTGPGVVSFCVLVADSIDRTTNARLIIDGTTIMDNFVFDAGDNGDADSLIGSLFFDTATTSIAIHPVPFESQFLLQGEAAAGAGTNNLDAEMLYWTRD